MGYKEDFKREELEHELYWEEQELKEERKNNKFNKYKKNKYKKVRDEDFTEIQKKYGKINGKTL